MIVGNKADLPRRQVKNDEGLQLAAMLSQYYCETSAKTGSNAKSAFIAIATHVRENHAPLGPLPAHTRLSDQEPSRCCDVFGR